MLLSMDRYVNFAPIIVPDDDNVVDGAVYKKEKHRSRVARSSSALSDGGAATARDQCHKTFLPEKTVP